jgi:hypothetical protein
LVPGDRYRAEPCSVVALVAGVDPAPRSKRAAR